MPANRLRCLPSAQLSAPSPSACRNLPTRSILLPPTRVATPTPSWGRDMNLARGGRAPATCTWRQARGAPKHQMCVGRRVGRFEVRATRTHSGSSRGPRLRTGGGVPWLFSTDHPHSRSPWPSGVPIVAGKAISEGAKIKLFGENANRFLSHCRGGRRFGIGASGLSRVGGFEPPTGGLESARPESSLRQATVAR